MSEDVTRAGVLVRLADARRRKLDGKPFVGLGDAKLTGRGENSSGHTFERVVNSKARPRLAPGDGSRGHEDKRERQ